MQTFYRRINPGLTNPLEQNIAAKVNNLERTSELIADNQEKLKTGQMKQEDFDRSMAEATKKVAEIAAKNPASAPVQTSAARAYTQAGDYGKAIAHAGRAMALAPNDPFPLTTRGFAYYQAKDFPKAAEDAKRALAIDPKDPVAHAIWMLSKDRGPGGSGANVPEAAARPGRDLVALPANPYASPPPAPPSPSAGPRPDDDPEVARYKTEEGRAYARQMLAAERAMKRKDYLTAFGLANETLAAYADNPRMLAVGAVSAWNLKDYRTAIADASLALKAQPDLYPLLTARAAAYNDMGRHDDALRDAEKALAVAPRNARALLERAVAREGLREPAENVLADYRRAAQLDAQFASDYDRALARLAPSAEQSAAKTAGAPVPERGAPAFLALLARRARGASSLSDFQLSAALAGLLVLAAAGFLVMRRD